MNLKLVRPTAEQNALFIEKFRVSMSKFIAPPLYDLDAIAFDKWLNVPDGVSTYDFIEDNYGNEALELVKDLHNIGLQPS
jgi:hypothetical protein